MRISVSMAVVIVALLVATMPVAAVGLIADPPVDGYDNLFAVLAPGEHIRAGTALGDGNCTFTEVVLPDGGFFNRGATGAYGISHTLQRAVIECTTPITGIAAHGDQDPLPGELPTVWYLDGEMWEPVEGANQWDTRLFVNIHRFEIVGGGDSMFVTIATGDATTTDLQEAAEPPAGTTVLHMPFVVTQ